MNTATQKRSPEYQSSFVHTPDVSLFVVEAGNPNNPAILFLHGYPDTHEVWSYQMAALADSYHVITFDIRGMGQSSVPSPIAGSYRFPQLIGDIHAVIDATCGKEGKVHLVGHDWGSVIGWSFVLNPQHNPRLLSWTSMSGPDLRLMQHNVLTAWKTYKPKHILSSLSQFIRSFYVYTMFIPKLWELAFGRYGKPKKFSRMLTRSGIPQNDPSLPKTKEALWHRLKHGLNLYRQNVFRWLPLPEKGACNVPTQLIMLTRDDYIRPVCFLDLDQFVNQLTRVELAEKHWAQKSNPTAVTQIIQTFIKEQEGH
ncbi:MAG: pimeloyl-ACP methyl ester carboxylesterase [Halioglobus sp.]|jgi:pimeloyl-ACP methyl ester carboxylesterase